MVVELTNDSKPFAIQNARVIPFAYRDQVKQTLDELVAQAIIAPVSEPTDWIHPLVVVPKENGKVRLCVDFTRLNQFVKRPVHPLASPKYVVGDITPGARLFTTFDAKSRYWQIPLAEESQILTTFITPWGRYKFLRGPMALVLTGDEFCRRVENALGHLPRLRRVVDDILVTGTELADHYSDVENVLIACRENGITLGLEKFKFAQPLTTFAGLVISENGVAADPRKLDAITEFPRPTNVTQLRSFFGLVNQLAEFSTEIAATAAPLRPLLRTDTPFVWTPDHDEAFAAVKRVLASPPILAPFDQTAETVLQTDASRKNGLGYALLQKQQHHCRLIHCGSRFVTDTESRYAMVELELKKAEWAMSKCRLYLLGLPRFTLVVDHQPLVTILDKYTLDAVENPRLQRLKERLTPYVFTTVWRKGKLHAIPDALSRAPVRDPSSDEEEETEVRSRIRCVIEHTIASIVTDDHNVSQRINDSLLCELRSAAAADPEYQQLVNAIKEGFPKTPEKLDVAIRMFWKLRSELWHDHGLALFGTRIIVPKSRRSEMLERLHAAHAGVECTKCRARSTIFWPSINSDITNIVRACEKCQLSQPSLPKEPLLNDPLPSRVFEDLSADLFDFAGSKYLVYVDRLSGWPTIDRWKGRDPNSADVTKTIRQNFWDLGVPVRIRTDGGPQFKSFEFSNFLRKWNVRLDMSTPHYPQSNGHAEAAVKAMKSLISRSTPDGQLDGDKFAAGMLEYRNTPRAHGLSPAEIVFGHPVRSMVPAHQSAFAPRWREIEAIQEKIRKDNSRMKKHYEKNSKALPSLQTGRSVRVQDPQTKQWSKRGVVVSGGTHRNYKMAVPIGGTVDSSARVHLH